MQYIENADMRIIKWPKLLARYWWVKHVNIEPELKLVTTYHIKFIVKYWNLWKYCECNITLLFTELRFLWFSGKGIQHFYYNGQNKLI